LTPGRSAPACFRRGIAPVALAVIAVAFSSNVQKNFSRNLLRYAWRSQSRDAGRTERQWRHRPKLTEPAYCHSAQGCRYNVHRLAPALLLKGFVRTIDAKFDLLGRIDVADVFC
jgi:hypothetical protein